MAKAALLKVPTIGERILTIRGQRVMLDRDLAELYGVETKYLKRQVKRNRKRFPAQFVFQLSKKEMKELVTNWHRFEPLKHSSTTPFVFTEHGVAMLASVLNSARAVEISIFIVQTFVKLRKMMYTHKELYHQLSLLKNRVDRHDEELQSIVEAIQQLVTPPDPPPKRRIGFGVEEPKVEYRVSRNRA
jgi:phage regulator Rha-like protein